MGREDDVFKQIWRVLADSLQQATEQAEKERRVIRSDVTYVFTHHPQLAHNLLSLAETRPPTYELFEVVEVDFIACSLLSRWLSGLTPENTRSLKLSDEDAFIILSLIKILLTNHVSEIDKRDRHLVASTLRHLHVDSSRNQH